MNESSGCQKLKVIIRSLIQKESDGGEYEEEDDEESDEDDLDETIGMYC